MESVTFPIGMMFSLVRVLVEPLSIAASVALSVEIIPLDTIAAIEGKVVEAAQLQAHLPVFRP
jgi:hypothetical protein